MNRTDQMTHRAHGRLLLVGAASALACASVLAACSSSSPSKAGQGKGGTTTRGGAAGQGAGPQGGNGQFGSGPRGPAASGLIAAVEASDIQVQNASTGQTTVNFTAKTRITETKATTKAALKVGVCVVAVTSAASPAATTVTISTPENGECTGGFGGGPVNGRSFPGGQRPSGFPSGARRSFPSGVPSGTRGTFGNAVVGKVTALAGDSLTILARERGTTTSSPSTSPKTVTLSATTKYEITAAATKAALKVGKCATAQGTTDSTGAVAATSIAVTPPVSGQCGFVFGRRVTEGNGNG